MLDWFLIYFQIYCQNQEFVTQTDITEHSVETRDPITSNIYKEVVRIR